MPHKHTRRERDLSQFDLPPTQLAKPLPVRSSRQKDPKKTAPSKGAPGKGAPGKPAPAKGATTQAQKPKSDVTSTARGTKRKRAGKTTEDGALDNRDTPRAFRRLMAVASGKRFRSGLDDGVSVKKGKGKGAKGKDKAASENAAAASPPAAAQPAVPAINPGERLSDYAARVDAALPISGLIKGKGGNVDPLGIAKTYRTKKERQMHKLYGVWHEEERKIQEDEAEARDLADERDLELDETIGVKWRLDFEREAATATASKKGKKNKAKALHGGDIWAEFNAKKAAASKSSGKTLRAGIHGSVEAPPQLTKINSKKFARLEMKKQAMAAKEGKAVYDDDNIVSRYAVSDIPRSVATAGLAEQGELQAARKDVLLAYKKRNEGRKQHRAVQAAKEE